MHVLRIPAFQYIQIAAAAKSMYYGPYQGYSESIHDHHLSRRRPNNWVPTIPLYFCIISCAPLRETKHLSFYFGVLDPAGFGPAHRKPFDEVQAKSIRELCEITYFQTTKIPSPTARVADPRFRPTYTETGHSQKPELHSACDFSCLRRHGFDVTTTLPEYLGPIHTSENLGNLLRQIQIQRAPGRPDRMVSPRKVGTLIGIRQTWISEFVWSEIGGLNESSRKHLLVDENVRGRWVPRRWSICRPAL